MRRLLLLCLVVGSLCLFPVLCGAQPRSVLPDLGRPLLKNLQHWWRARPGFVGGDKVFDVMPGTLDHLTLTNMGYSAASGWSAGSRPTSVAQLNFDGTNDYARGTQSAGTFTDTTPFSFCVWVYPLTLATGAQVVFGTYDGSAGIFQGVRFLWSYNGSYPKFMLGDTGGWEQDVLWSSGSWPIVANVWQHWCGVRTGVGGAAGMSLYYNGRLQTVAQGGNASFGSPFPSTLPWNMGAHCCNPVGSYFQGALDEVMVWYNRALGDAEIATVYQQSLLGHPDLFPPLAPLGLPLAGGTPPGSFMPMFR